MSAPATPRETEIRGWLTAHIAQVSGLPAECLSEDEPLATLGLGSSEFVTLSGELEEWLGDPVPPTIVWEHPTIAQLARALSAGERQ